MLWVIKLLTLEGVLYSILYDSSIPVHVQRAHKSFVNAMGERDIPGRFATMLIQARHAQSLLDVSN